jgi:hypothetical protein
MDLPSQQVVTLSTIVSVRAPVPLTSGADTRNLADYLAVQVVPAHHTQWLTEIFSRSYAVGTDVVNRQRQLAATSYTLPVAYSSHTQVSLQKTNDWVFTRSFESTARIAVRGTSGNAIF